MANFIPTSLITDFHTMILIVLLLVDNVKVPISEPCLVSHPAQGAAPAAVVSAVNLATVAEVLIPDASGFATFSYPNPPPFSNVVNVHVEPGSPDSNVIGALCEKPISNKKRKKVKVIFLIILVI